MNALTADLGRFVSDLRLAQVPPEAQAVIKTGFADCFGVMVAGARDPAVALVDRTLAGADGAEQASLVPGGERRNVEDAALVNGVAAHVLDYDDVTLDGHPSAVLVPAILAQAEVCGSSGAEMLTAYAAGYEVWVELLVREPVPLHQKGWHPTAVRGTIAAAAACARLRRLDAGTTTAALAIAASMAGGLVANFGTLTKSLQVGRAAQSGVLAARLAAAGLSASPDTLEHPSGFLAAYSPEGRAARDLPFDSTDKEWHLVRQGLNVKRYPICYAAHRAIDGAIDLAERYGLAAENIASVRVATGEMQMVMLRNDRPQTALEAKFSLPFAVASAIVAKNVGLLQMTDEFVRSGIVQQLFPLVSHSTTTETLNGSAFAPSDSVEIVTKVGDVLDSGPIIYAKGSAERPLNATELYTKFADCLGEGIDDAAKTRAFDRLMTLERANGAADLIAV